MSTNLSGQLELALDAMKCSVSLSSSKCPPPFQVVHLLLNRPAIKNAQDHEIWTYTILGRLKFHTHYVCRKFFCNWICIRQLWSQDITVLSHYMSTKQGTMIRSSKTCVESSSAKSHANTVYWQFNHKNQYFWRPMHKHVWKFQNISLNISCIASWI